MIESSTESRKYDRLFAFMCAFPLEAEPSDTATRSNLLIVARDGGAAPTHIHYRPRAGGLAPLGTRLAQARLDFGGALNPLVGALPPEIIFDLSQDAPLRALADLTLAEEQYSRCGSSFVGKRLSEVIVVHAMRRAIAQGTVHAGLLTGLAHPDLHPCLVAMHDDPARAWRIGDLADLSGMSRSRFIRSFGETVGQSPIAYLNDWRLNLARVLLADGGRIKSIAARVGFGSAAAFSRAFSRKFGSAPSEITARYRAQFRGQGSL